MTDGRQDMSEMPQKISVLAFAVAATVTMTGTAWSLSSCSTSDVREDGVSDNAFQEQSGTTAASDDAAESANTARVAGQTSTTTSTIQRDDAGLAGDGTSRDADGNLMYKGIRVFENDGRTLTREYRDLLAAEQAKDQASNRPTLSERDRGYEQDALELDEVDRDRAAEAARKFADAFYTYTNTTLRNGSYKMSFSPLIADGSNTSTGTSKLIYIHSDRTWQAALGSYERAFSNLTAFEADSVYISHETHDGEIAVSCDLIVDRNQGQPGDMNWDVVNTYKIRAAVYLDAGYAVTDVREQDFETVNSNIFGYETTRGNAG